MGQSNDISQLQYRHREATAELVTVKNGQLYIGGEWVDSVSGETFATRNPSTGEELASVSSGNTADIDRAVDAAWDGYENHWADTSAKERQRILLRIADRIEHRAEEFARLDVLDNGKPITEARTDIELVIDHYRYFAGALRVHEGSTIPSEPDEHIQTLHEPYGVVGQIIPWNFPLLMSAWKLAPALAAGNAVVLKPAEETPLSILEFVREVEDLFPPGVLNVVTGYGTQAGTPLVSHDDVPKIAFTGSTEVGHGIMKEAANSISDVTLELGGKSPLVIFPDADLDKAVDVAVESMFFNTGECCCAGTRLFIHSDVSDPFVDDFVTTVSDLKMGDPLDDATELGPKISQAQINRTEQYIKLARESGAEILLGGRQPAHEALVDGYFIHPTIIQNIEHDSRIAQEEVFGPVELLFEWEEYDELIKMANDIEFGLAAGLVTEDLQTVHRAARDIDAGNIWVNKYNTFPAGQPFGGYKQSGSGRETAFQTLDEYTQTKTINMSFE